MPSKNLVKLTKTMSTRYKAMIIANGGSTNIGYCFNLTNVDSIFPKKLFSVFASNLSVSDCIYLNALLETLHRI